MSIAGRAPIETAFSAPGEAQVFAMVQTLRQRELFTADEWSSAGVQGRSKATV
jgi:hypothetical protein